MAFAQKIRRMCEWAEQAAELPPFISERLMKVRRHCQEYAVAYYHLGSHRTSNMLDRIMQRMDRRLFTTQYFHGNLHAARLAIRGWSLINNFAPSNPITVKKHGGLRSQAQRLNRKTYSNYWLQNLLCSASLVTGKTLSRTSPKLVISRKILTMIRLIS